MNINSAFTSSAKLRVLISFTLTVASFPLYASGCDPTEASLTGCMWNPPHGCAIQKDIPCIDDRPLDYNESSIDQLYRFYDEISEDVAKNVNMVPHLTTNGISASCASGYATRLAYAISDISPYIKSNAEFGSPFLYKQVVVTYPNGHHELWRLWNTVNYDTTNYATPALIGHYFGSDAVIGSNSSGSIYISMPVALNDPAPTCAN